MIAVIQLVNKRNGQRFGRPDEELAAIRTLALTLTLTLNPDPNPNPNP